MIYKIHTQGLQLGLFSTFAGGKESPPTPPEVGSSELPALSSVWHVLRNWGPKTVNVNQGNRTPDLGLSPMHLHARSVPARKKTHESEPPLQNRDGDSGQES